MKFINNKTNIIAYINFNFPQYFINLSIKSFIMYIFIKNIELLKCLKNQKKFLICTFLIEFDNKFYLTLAYLDINKISRNFAIYILHITK